MANGWIMTLSGASRKSSRNLIVFALASSIVVSEAVGASFTEVDIKRFQAWESGLLKNKDGNRFFCSAETNASDGTVLRVSVYKASNDAFLEVFNNRWRFREGAVTFSLEFDDRLTMELSGKSWGDSYTYDFLENEKMDLVLGTFIKFNQLRVVNSNGTSLALFSLKGAGDAIRNFFRCLKSS